MKLYSFLVICTVLTIGSNEEHDLIIKRRFIYDVNDCTAPIPSIKPNSLVGTLEDAFYNVNYAGAAYCESSTIKEWSCSYCKSIGDQIKVEAIMDDNEHKTRVFVAVDESRHEIILAFRGSVAILNWIKGFENAKTKYQKVPNAEVHTGFFDCAEGLFPLFKLKVQELLSQETYRDYGIVLIGHSLGGAVAVFSAINLQEYLDLPWSRFSIFTYGQPRIGNLAFANWVNTIPFTITRVVNENDMVAHNPRLELCYIHHHTEVYVNKNDTRYCNYDYMEDPQCSRSQLTNLSPKAHNQIWDISLGSDNC